MIFETMLDSFSQEWILFESLKRYTAMSIAVNGHLVMSSWATRPNVMLS